MKRLAVLLFALVGCDCAHTPPAAGPRLTLAPDVALNRDQMLVCGFLKERNMLVCMTPEEFRIRMEANEWGKPSSL